MSFSDPKAGWQFLSCYSQLLVIQVSVGLRTGGAINMPGVFVLMPSRKQDAYLEVFEILNNKLLPKYCQNFEPKNRILHSPIFVTDSELGLYQVRYQFLSVTHDSSDKKK